MGFQKSWLSAFQFRATQPQIDYKQCRSIISQPTWLILFELRKTTQKLPGRRNRTCFCCTRHLPPTTLQQLLTGTNTYQSIKQFTPQLTWTAGKRFLVKWTQITWSHLQMWRKTAHKGWKHILHEVKYNCLLRGKMNRRKTQDLK